MSNNYETLYILRPDLGEEVVQQQVERYRTLITEHSATDIQVKVWGKKRLAYPIKKLNDGVYVQMNYQASGKQVAPM
ncbi:MAG: 30S ribosomal protein S6, partial [Microcystis aeruginosa]